MPYVFDTNAAQLRRRDGAYSTLHLRRWLAAACRLLVEEPEVVILCGDLPVSDTLLLRERLTWSGRQDLNLRPLRPERNALAKLSYAPTSTNARRGMRRQR
jgi:hypothetical protein